MSERKRKIGLVRERERKKKWSRRVRGRGEGCVATLAAPDCHL